MKNNSYDDIINLPHPVSKNHPQMPLRDRAAQFAPFAALTGHDAAIKETARLTDERLELSEEVIAQLNEKINIIRNNIGIEQKVSITYFIPDAKKAGGSYVNTDIDDEIALNAIKLLVKNGISVNNLNRENSVKH